MKKIIFKIIFAITVFFNCYADSKNYKISFNNINKKDPLIVTAIMIKNEEKVIVDTIDPFVKAGLDSFFIYDTGSTDKTVETVKNYFQNNKIQNSVIVEEPFIDFSASRNKALEYIEKNFFPEAKFIVMLDAEWYINNAKDLVSFCNNNVNLDPNKAPCFDIKIKGPGAEFYVTRVIKCKSQNRFHGRVHETLTKSPVARVPQNVYFEYSPKPESAEKTRQRWLRDKDLLMQDHLEDPNNLRTLYYLAQTYFDLQEFETAAKYFKMYTEKDKQSEYSYLAYYNLAKCMDSKFEQDKDDDKWHETALKYYLTTIKISPERIEPYVRIANHYLNTQNWHLGFIYARHACEFGNLTREYIWFEKDIYDYNRYDILSVLAWNIGEYELGEKALRKAIEARPDKEHLKNNLKQFLNRKK